MSNLDLSTLSEEELRTELLRRKKASKKYSYSRNRILVKQTFTNEKIDLNKIDFSSDKKRTEAEKALTSAEIIFSIDKNGKVEAYAFNGKLLSPRTVNYSNVIDSTELKSE